MSLKDVTIDNSVKELEKIKALLELSILKNASNIHNFKLNAKLIINA